MSDEAKGRPGLPDPQTDRHVAFPDEPVVGSLPASAWAPAPGSRPRPTPQQRAGPPPPPPPLTFPNDPAMYSLKKRRRGGAGAVVAVLAGLVLMGNTTSEDDPYAYGGPDAPTVEVWPVIDADPAGLAPLDPSLEADGVASRPTSLRIEVVGTATDVELQLTSPAADADATIEELPHEPALSTHVSLPYAGTLPLDGSEASVRVVARIAAVDDSQVQCRVYDGSRLLSEDSTPGLAVCEVDLGP